MDVTSAPAGSAQSSFLSFATVLADVRHLSLAERLSSGDAAGPEDSSESSQLGTAMRFAQTCLERAAAAEGAEVGFAMSTKLAADATDFDTDDGQEEDRNNWILEARTWELLHYLCADRYLQRDQSEVRPDSSRDEEGPFVPGSQNLADLYYQTPFAAVQDILLSNRELRELKVRRDVTLRHRPLLTLECAAASIVSPLLLTDRPRLALLPTSCSAHRRSPQRICPLQQEPVKSRKADACSFSDGESKHHKWYFDRQKPRSRRRVARSGQMGPGRLQLLQGSPQDTLRVCSLRTTSCRL